MKLILVSAPPYFIVDCVGCRRRLQSNRERIYADAEGKPYVDYYCGVCFNAKRGGKEDAQ